MKGTDEVASGRVVLVVDDEPSIRELLKRFLEQKGYRFLGASTATEGIEKFAQRTPPIVLLDLVLPDRNGLEVLQEIRRIDADAKVIMITTAEEELFGERVLKLGAAAFIENPLDLAQLEKVLQRLQ